MSIIHTAGAERDERTSVDRRFAESHAPEGHAVERFGRKQLECRRCLAPLLLLLLLLLLLCSTSRVLALDPDRSLSQLHHTSWTAQDGAPSQISALAQTTDGYLWIGSARGLFRFDGVTFERFVPSGGATLPSHNVYALLATPDGGLWISFRPSGLGYLEAGQLETFVQPGELPSTPVYAFACDLEGRVWAATHDALCFRDGARWVDASEEWGFPANKRVRSLFVDSKGTLWVATDDAILFLERGARSFVLTSVPIKIIPGIAQSPNGDLWIAEEEWTRRIPVSGRAAEESRIIAGATLPMFDRDGCLWIAAYDDGLIRVRDPEKLGAGDVYLGDPRLEQIDERGGLSGVLARVLLEDREGSIWVGTAKGLDRFRNNQVVSVELPPGHFSFTLLASDDGEIRVASATGKPLIRIVAEGRAGELPNHRRFDAESAGVDHVFVDGESWTVSCVYRAPDGIIWWGGNAGMWRQDGDQSTFFPNPPEAKDEFQWEIFGGDEPGALWVSVGDLGLLHFKDGTWTKRELSPELPGRGPSASFTDSDDRVWLGYTENRACLLDRGNVQAFSWEDGIEVGRVRVIRGNESHVWLGGELGLCVYREQVDTDGGGSVNADHAGGGDFRASMKPFHRITAAGASPFGTISGIIETADGELWLNEMQGIVRIPAEEVRRVLQDPSHQVAFRRYDVQDGLPGAGQMNWTCSTAIAGTDGRLWFATDNGLAWIDPRRDILNDVPPPVHIRAVATETQVYEPSSSLRLPKRTTGVRVDYTALSLVIPERVRFRYRLVGGDDDWHDAGQRRSAFFTRLRPGDYRFQVVASNNDGVWNSTGAETEFSVAPAFYQTSWFFALCGVSLLGLLWSLYLLRVRQMSSRMLRIQEERVAERMRIAHELHDTLLQGVLSASMKLHVAAGSIPEHSPTRRQVDHVLTLMRQVTGDARDALQGLRDSTTGAPPEELIHALSRIRDEFMSSDTIGFRIEANGRPRRLSPVVRDDVYSIGRESLVNAFRHSGAGSIEVELHYLSGQFRLLVRDNGRGIDPLVLRSGREGHWGLPGMRERAERMGGRLHVRSRTGLGTEVELSVPGRLAFLGERSPGFLSRLKRARFGRRVPRVDESEA